MQSAIDRRFASVIGLGRFRKLYAHGLAYRLFSLLLIGLLAYPIVAYFVNPGRLNGWEILHLVAALVVAPFAVWMLWRQQGDAIAVYEGGIAYYNHEGLLVLPWADITRLEEDVSYSSAGDTDVVTPVFMLETRAGQRLTVPATFFTWNFALWDAIGEGVAKDRLEGDLDAIRAGRTLDFGRFQVSARGLQRIGKVASTLLEWERIRAVEDKRVGGSPVKFIDILIEAENPSQRKSWKNISCQGIPNAQLFITLCRHFIEDRMA